MLLLSYLFVLSTLVSSSPPPSYMVASLPAHEQSNLSQRVFGLSAPSEGVKAIPESLTTVNLDLTSYEIQGYQLTQRQIRLGLKKDLERTELRDQSLEGLRDIINDSSDPEIKDYLPIIDRLENSLERNQDIDQTYTQGLIRYFAPLTVFLQQKTGIPASIIMSQIILESGWGSSNITILKNNILGIGNSTSPDDFYVTLKLNGFERRIHVRCLQDTTAYKFDSIADSIFYYVYVLLQSPENAGHYAQLRNFLKDQSPANYGDMNAYRQHVLKLIASSYHSDPDWYVDYLETVLERVKKLDQYKLATAPM